MRSKLGTKSRLAAHISAFVLLVLMLVYVAPPQPKPSDTAAPSELRPAVEAPAEELPAAAITAAAPAPREPAAVVLPDVVIAPPAGTTTDPAATLDTPGAMTSGGIPPEELRPPAAAETSVGVPALPDTNEPAAPESGAGPEAPAVLPEEPAGPEVPEALSDNPESTAPGSSRESAETAVPEASPAETPDQADGTAAAAEAPEKQEAAAGPEEPDGEPGDAAAAEVPAEEFAEAAAGASADKTEDMESRAENPDVTGEEKETGTEAVSEPDSDAEEADTKTDADAEEPESDVRDESGNDAAAAEGNAAGTPPVTQPDETGALVVADGNTAAAEPLAGARLEVLDDSVYWLDAEASLEEDLSLLPDDLGTLILLTPLPGFRVPESAAAVTEVIPAAADDLSNDAAARFLHILDTSPRPAAVIAIPGAHGAAFYKGVYLLVRRGLDTANMLSEIEHSLGGAGAARNEVVHRLYRLDQESLR